MPDSAPISSFLEAEAKARELVDELARLKESVQSYRNAGQALNEVAAAIGELAGRLQGLVEGNGNVLEALRSIGTPELLQRQEEVARLLAQKFDESSAERRAFANEHAQRQDDLSRLVTQKFDEGRAEHGALRRTIDDNVRTIEARLIRLTRIARATTGLNILLAILVISLLLRGL